MPELPEVETVCRSLASKVIGRRITAVAVYLPRMIHHPAGDGAAFAQGVTGQKIKNVTRRGKYILLHLSAGDSLIVHLRMTGKLLVAAGTQARGKHVHVVLDLDDGQKLLYDDVRQFGGFSLVKTAALQQVGGLSTLGPEPLGPDFTIDHLWQICKKRKVKIKSLLLDQHVVAGIGNIYADEVLFRAGVRPLRRCDRLRKKDVAALVEAIKFILARAIELGGSSIKDYVDADGQAGAYQRQHMVYGRGGLPCKVCGTILTKAVVGGRSTVYCPKDQR